MSAGRSRKVEELFEHWVEERVVRRATVDPESLCADQPELLAPLRRLIAAYSEVDLALEEGVPPPCDDEGPRAVSMPSFDGLRTIERLGRGGSGEVYKVEDLELGRTLAAKILRADGPLATGFDRFLGEARALALFDDPRIVRIHEFRGEASPPVLLMEYVEGFELGRIAPSLEYAQRARLMAEIADAIQRAHDLGLTHRDLKPANVLVDARLSPRILDFGLSSSDPAGGHGVGTPAYMAPEQLDAGCRIDARTDVYALGVMLYELLCGERPYDATSEPALLSAIREGSPRLPLEIDPAVPEPLQAIALKAMERRPEARYGSAREMARDLARWLDGGPVEARPSLYQGALERRVRPHLEQLGEWVRLRLIYPHEKTALTRAYERLSGRDDDWIVGSRFLSLSSIVLYLGACLLGAGAILYYAAHSLEAVTARWLPVVVLALPFAGINLAARRLHQGNRRLVAVAYYMAAAVLLPLLLLILLDDLGAFAAAADDGQLLGEWPASDRRLQIVAAIACAWSIWLAMSTRTVALGATATIFGVLCYIFVLAEFGLRGWLDESAWDSLGRHLLPLTLICGGLGIAAERGTRAWFARPLYPVAAGVALLALELLALDGKLFATFGISMAPFQPADVSDPRLLDTLAGMTVVGVLCYAAARLLESRGTRLMQASTMLLFVVSPFAILQPLYLLNQTGEYSRRFDWLYLTLSVAMALASHFGQRRSFFYAGVLNTLAAVWLLTSHYEWLDRPAWAVAVVLAGLSLLAGGWALNRREARRDASG